jgi:CubicO group peptidase (beta-lactamase class C family)
MKGRQTRESEDVQIRIRRILESLTVFALCLHIWAIGGHSPANAAPGEPSPSIVAHLERELRHQDFSGILEVRAGGRSLYRYASEREINPRSVFWVGSVSKQFAAVAALRLVEQGKLSLDEPMAERLGLKDGALQFENVPATLADVLHHTSGLPSGNVCTIPSLDREGPQQAFLKCVGDLKLGSRPGSQFAYSNVGYDLVGILVARASGMPYGEFLRKEFFVPLGMKSTGVNLRESGDAQQRLVQGEAFFGFGWARTWPWLLLDPTGPGTAGASGNLYSTTDDLHTWNQALHGGRLLSPAIYKRFLTPALDNYGLGVAVEKSRRGTPWIWHNGSLSPMGWSSYVAYIPENEVSVVGLANRTIHTSHVMQASRNLVLASLGEDVEPPLLEPLTDQDRVREMVFFIVPLILAGAVLSLGWDLTRGPRGRPVKWVSALLLLGSLSVFIASMFDFYGRAPWLALSVIASAATGIVLHRQGVGGSLRQSWTDKKERSDALANVFAAGVLAVVADPSGRVWLSAYIASLGVLVCILAACKGGLNKQADEHFSALGN